MRRLSHIAKKHENYFYEQGLTVYDCVEIKHDMTISVHITKPDLPFDIQFEIETACWVE
jgi:hypothetical protein